MNIVEVKEASKRYGEVVALSRFDMTVKEGLINGFVGPNGAGKSTTLRLITGLTWPDNGTVTVFGEKAFGNIVAKERIGFVSEHDDLYPWAKVWEIVKYLAQLSKPFTPNLEQRVGQAIESVKMSKFIDRPVATLSKGMKQRIKIAAALAHEPDFLIMDEPLSGLDPLGRRTVMDLLRNLCAERGVTVLISSHILEELEDLVDRVTLIHRGQTLAEGSPDGIRNLLYKYPHEIIFSASPENSRILASSLAEIEGLIRSIVFEEIQNEITQCRVVTPKPGEFYDELVRLSVEKNAPVLQIDTLSESVERLFEFLVTGGRM